MKTGLKTVAIIIILIMGSAEMFAQNIFYDSDRNGGHFGLNYARISDVKSFGAQFGHSWQGRMTVSLGFGVSRFRGETIASDFGAAADALLLKQNDLIPLSFGLGAYYSLTDIVGTEINASQFGVTASIYREFRDNNFSAIPSLFLVVGKTKFSEGAFAETQDGVAYGARLYLRFSDVYLAPTMQIQDGESSFQLALGFLFGRANLPDPES